MEIERLGPEDRDRVLAAATLFDGPARADWTPRFLAEDGHHLLIASVDGVDVGFVSGVETSHPDKGTEMFLYELGVDEPYRRRGIGRALVAAWPDSPPSAAATACGSARRPTTRPPWRPTARRASAHPSPA